MYQIITHGSTRRLPFGSINLPVRSLTKGKNEPWKRVILAPNCDKASVQPDGISMTSFPSRGSINLHALHVTREMLIEAIREKQASHYSSQFATHRDAAEGQLYPVRFNKKVQRFELGGPLTCGIRN